MKPSMMMNENKVMVIGIDGGTFDVILPMIQGEGLPHLASLMKEGAWGPLQSTIPANTGPAWVSMMTGTNPGKHGIFFFLGNRHNNYKDERSLGSTDIRFPPLWSILSKNKKKVIFVNVPFTYPPTQVNGVLISGMYIPDSAEVVSYPASLYPDIVRRLGKYDINDWDPQVFHAELLNLPHHYDEVIDFMEQTTEERKKATLTLLKENDWDFSMVVFTSIDRLQHLFWKFMDPLDHNFNQGLLSKYRTVIYKGYQQLDNAIGEILKKVGNNTTVFIVSDHGFGPSKKDFFVNKWLEEIGLLKIKKGLGAKNIRLTVPLYKILTKVMPQFSPPIWTQKIPIPFPRKFIKDRGERINWKKTKAYADEFGVNINLRGREPYGMVNPGIEVEELVKLIQEQFSLLVDEAESQDKIGDWILRKESIYHGPFVEEATDLYLSVGGESYLLNPGIERNAKFSDATVKVSTGIHRINGIFIVRGAHCNKDVSVSPRIIDITPTILYLMGLPLLEEMDGRVLGEIIDPAYLRSNPIRHIKPWDYGEISPHYSLEDEEKIKKSLKGLGYLP